jgi:hypothetical protein
MESYGGYSRYFERYGGISDICRRKKLDSGSNPLKLKIKQQLLPYNVQTMPPLEEFTTSPEWFFPSMNGPPVQDFEMSIFNTDDVMKISGS